MIGSTRSGTPSAGLIRTATRVIIEASTNAVQALQVAA